MGKNNGNKESSADDEWERMIDNGSLDRAVEKLSMKSNTNFEKDSNEAPRIQVRLEEQSTRTSFTPTVRILKRETGPVKIAVRNELVPNNANEAPTKRNPTATKTFAQRADEYARARARIMGTQTAPAVPNGNIRNTILDAPNNRHQDGQPPQFFRDRRANGR